MSALRRWFRSAPLQFSEWAFDKWSPYESNPDVVSGNVDFGAVFPQAGFAYISDSVGHNYVAKGKEFQVKRNAAIWDSFNAWVINELTPIAGSITLDQYVALIDERLQQLDARFNKLGTSATLLTSKLIGEQLQITAVGDSVLIAVPVFKGAAEPAQRLAPVAGDSKAELGTEVRDRLSYAVNLGDDVLLILLTDGVYEFLWDGTSDYPFPEDGALPVITELAQKALQTPNAAQTLAVLIRARSLSTHANFPTIPESKRDDSSEVVIRVSKAAPVQLPEPIGSPPPALARQDVYTQTAALLDQVVGTLAEGTKERQIWGRLVAEPTLREALGECSAIVAQLPNDPRFPLCNSLVGVLQRLVQMPRTDDSFVTLLEVEAALKRSVGALQGGDPQQLQTLGSVLSGLENTLDQTIRAGRGTR